MPKRNGKNLYVVSMLYDAYDLPIFSGDAEETSRFLGFKSVKSFYIAAKRGRAGGRFKIERVKDIPDEFLLCELMCQGVEEE